MGVNLRQNPDDTFDLHSDPEGKPVLKVGGPAAASVSAPQYRGVSRIKMPLAAGTDTAGAVLSWQNELGYDIIVSAAILDITTVAAAACTLDVGETASSGTTAATNLFSAQDVHTAAGVFISSAKAVKVPAGDWITASTHSGGASAGLVGNLYLDYSPA